MLVDGMLLSDSESGDADGTALSVSAHRDVAPKLLTGLIEQAMGGGTAESQVVLLGPDDLSERFSQSPSPILSGLERSHAGRSRSHLLRAEVLSLSPPERRSSMQRFVVGELAGVLGLSEEQRGAVDLSSQIDSLGLDSLMTMELFMGMGRELDLEIAADWFGAAPSLGEVASVLVERLIEAAAEGVG